MYTSVLRKVKLQTTSASGRKVSGTVVVSGGNCSDKRSSDSDSLPLVTGLTPMEVPSSELEYCFFFDDFLLGF